MERGEVNWMVEQRGIFGNFKERNTGRLIVELLFTMEKVQFAPKCWGLNGTALFRSYSQIVIAHNIVDD